MGSSVLPRAAVPARRAVRLGALLTAGAVAACAPAEPAAVEVPPDVLVVVWDTVRADRLSAYGYERPTSPWLERFAADATTFECVAPGSNTVATHGSLLTGLPPSEHGATFRNKHLPLDHETLPERLSEFGYATWLYSANPIVSGPASFDQGFEVVDHPWDDDRIEAACDAVRPKVGPGDNGTGVRRRIEVGDVDGSDLAGSGELAGQALAEWLVGDSGAEAGRPVFALVNLMDAHYPLQPARRFRERLVGEEYLAASYTLDRAWNDLWRHVAGVEPMDERTLALSSRLYDAALAELDAHTEALVGEWERLLGPERAARAIVVVTSDHGEHLGEVRGGVPLMDHRYSLQDELLWVPLVVRAPGRLPAGEQRAGAMVQDLFPSILAWTGAGEPELSEEAYARRLDGPADPNRRRVSEYLDDFGPPAAERVLPRDAWRATRLGGDLVSLRGGDEVVERHRGLDLTRRWRLVHPPGADGTRAGTAGQVPLEGQGGLREALERFEARLRPHPRLNAPPPELSAEQLEMLERLGYGDHGR